jgi:hypothetical protein
VSQIACASVAFDETTVTSAFGVLCEPEPSPIRQHRRLNTERLDRAAFYATVLLQASIYTSRAIIVMIQPMK